MFSQDKQDSGPYFQEGFFFFFLNNSRQLILFCRLIGSNPNVQQIISEGSVQRVSPKRCLQYQTYSCIPTYTEDPILFKWKITCCVAQAVIASGRRRKKKKKAKIKLFFFFLHYIFFWLSDYMRKNCRQNLNFFQQWTFHLYYPS